MRTTNRWHWIVVLTVLLGCSSEAKRSLSDSPPKIDDGWEVASPSQFNANMELLKTMVREVEIGEYTNIHSVLVIKGGALVVEEYFDGYDRDALHEIRSATKSIGSILTGIAIDRGFLPSENEPIYSFFKEDYDPEGGWSDQARRVEVRHFLSMMSGYDCDDLATDFACEDAMYSTDDWVQYALDLPFAHEPGQHWAYNSSSLILVGEAIVRGSGLKIDDFADRFLFGPIGIKQFRWNTSPKGRAWIGGGARMIPREMAKIGLLMLNRGVWKGERLLSERWIDISTRKQGDMLAGVDYGYLWQRGWTYVGDRLVTAYWASGNGGQYIIVLPDHDMVVVFTGGNFNSPLAGQPFRMLVQYILPAFLHPAPLDTATLSSDELARLTGVYRLDFEPSATSTVRVDDGRLHLISPDNEDINLVAHTPLFFTADSRYGPLTVLFVGNVEQGIDTLKVYGAFSRFVFVKR